MPQSNFIALNQSFINAGSSLIGFQIKHEEKRIHYSVSNMFLERLQVQFPDNWLKILNDGMIYEFRQWERGIFSNMYQEGFFSWLNYFTLNLKIIILGISLNPILNVSLKWYTISKGITIKGVKLNV